MFGNAPAPLHLQYVSQEDTRIPKVELPFAAATVLLDDAIDSMRNAPMAIQLVQVMISQVE